MPDAGAAFSRWEKCTYSIKMVRPRDNDTATQCRIVQCIGSNLMGQLELITYKLFTSSLPPIANVISAAPPKLWQRHRHSNCEYDGARSISIYRRLTHARIAFGIRIEYTTCREYLRELSM